MSNFEIFIINLERSVDRRKAMTKNMDKSKAPWRFIQAIDGSSLSKEELTSKTTWWSRFVLGRSLIPNEIGCYLSHVKAAKTLLESSMDFIIVLEDDCSITEDFDKGCSLLSKTKNWDVIRLEKRHDKTFSRELTTPKDSPFKIKRVDWSLYGAVGYALSREGANKVLATSKKITWPFDILFTRYWAHSLRYYALEQPIVIWNEEVNSIIGQEAGGRVNANKLTFPYIGKRIRMVYDGIMRRVYKFFIRHGII